METKKQKKTKTQSTTKTNDIATSNTTPNPDPTTGVVAGTVSDPPGSKAAAEKLIAQAVDSAGLAAVYAVALAARQYTDRDVGQLNADKDAFSKAYKKAEAAREASKNGTAQHRAVVQDGVKFRDEVVAGLREATLGKPNPMKNPRLLLSRTKQPQRLALWYRAVANAVEVNNAALTVRFGQDAVALLATKTQQLDAANAAQHAARPAALEEATREMQATQVKLAGSIAKLRYVAGMAFAGDKEMLKKFVPTWAHRNRAKKGATTQSGAGDSASGSTSSTSAGSSAAGALPAGSAAAGASPTGSAPAGSASAGSAPAGDGSAGLLPAGSGSPSTETAALKPAAHVDAKSAS